MMAKKAPNPTDVHVGARVRMRRMMLGLTQEKLAAGLGLTFQQVQKYEKGANRVGASRLQQIAHVLQVTPSFFFDGGPSASEPSGDAESPTFVAEFLATSDGLSIARSFLQIKDGKLRRAIVEMIERVASLGGTE